MRMLKAFMVAALVVAVSAGAASAQTSWTGSGDGITWSQALNWSAGVPVANEAKFNLGLTYPVNVDVAATCAPLKVYNDNVTLNVDVATGDTLTITGRSYIGVSGTDTGYLKILGQGITATPDVSLGERVYIARDSGSSVTGTLEVVDAYFLATSALQAGVCDGATVAGQGNIILKGAKVEASKLYAGFQNGGNANRAIVTMDSKDGVRSIFTIPNAGEDDDLILIGGGDSTGHPSWLHPAAAAERIGSATCVIDDSDFQSYSMANGFGISTGMTGNMTAADESFLTLQNTATWDQYGTQPGQNVVGAGIGTLELKSGSTMTLQCQLFVGGNLNMANGGAQNLVGPTWAETDGVGIINSGTGTVIINDGTSITIDNAGGDPPLASEIRVFNNKSVINVDGTLRNKTGGLYLTGGASGTNGTVAFGFSNPKHGRVIIEAAGESADITKIGDAPLGFSFLGGGNTFVPTVAGCMDFIVAETITGFLTNAADAAYDNMDELLAAANGGKGYPSYAYGIVTIDSDDYVGGAYDGYKALRLSVLPADADLGGLCDGSDLLTWQNGYSNGDTTWDKGDYNLSGLVDGPDLLIWQNNYGKTLGDCSGMGATGAAAAVPEPATLCLLGLGALALIRRRR